MTEINKFPHEVKNFKEIKADDRIEVTLNDKDGSVLIGRVKTNVATTPDGLLELTTGTVIKTEGIESARILSRKREWAVNDQIRGDQLNELAPYTIVCGVEYLIGDALVSYWIKTDHKNIWLHIAGNSGDPRVNMDTTEGWLKYFIVQINKDW